MFKDYWKYQWVLEVYRYNGLEGLMTFLKEKVITPAEAKVRELEEKRKAIEEELNKRQSPDIELRIKEGTPHSPGKSYKIGRPAGFIRSILLTKLNKSKPGF
jgi:hypothetical protein